jgi:ankyrin repeat protein
LAQAQLDSPSEERFIGAIARNDTNTAWRMLEENTNLIYAPYGGGRFPLLEAAAAGNAPLVKRILELGADLNTEGDILSTMGSKMTALDEAVQHGHLEVCKVLLEAGANPNHRAFQVTTLHMAFDSVNRNAVATLLLEYGANPFKESSYSRITPLELAITKSDGQLVPLMLSTRREIKSASSSRADSLSRKQAKEEEAQFLAAHGTAMLSAAVQRNELVAAEALLKAGVSVKTNAPGEMPVLEVFAISKVSATRDWLAAVAQWQQTSNIIRQMPPDANRDFLASIYSQEAKQAAKIASLAPERWRPIRDLLIRNGADYDVFAATALADTNQAADLLRLDRTILQARDRDGQTPLHWAVLYDQLPLTSFWLQAGASPAATNAAGQTPLHIAATKGLTEQVTLLLADHAPTDIRDTNGWTPLDAAIQAKQTDCIHLLMAMSPTGTHPERGLTSPLHEAAASGNVAALVALLDTETNLEVRDELGLTPLEVAVMHGHLAAAALLVDKGADVNVRDPNSNTLLHQIFLQDQFIIYDRPPTAWLARVGQDPAKKLYLKYLADGQDDQNPNALLQAASFLLASGADVTATNSSGVTALQLIVDGKTGRGVFFFNDDRTKLLQLLGAKGGNLNERDAAGNSPLHLLSGGGYDMDKVDQMASLIASGADVNATNSEGQTPLHVAAEKIGGWDNNDPPVGEPFQLLIYRKANVNAQDNQGLTPLDVIAMSDSFFRKEATRALLDAGANPNLRDNQGRTAAHLFLSGKWPWDDAEQCIDMLVVAGADLSIKDGQGRTPLHYLAALGNQSPMFFLRGIGDTFLLAKVDLSARDNAGDTPLHIAARTGTRDVYDWLIKQGCDPDVANNAGETPRQLAMQSPNPFSFFHFNPDINIFEAIREGKLQSVATILKSEPDSLNQTNQFGQTPLLLAAQTRHTNIVDYLDTHGVRWDPTSAILMGRTGIVRQLIAQNAQLARDGSLLRLAAGHGSVADVKILLAAGADVKATDSDGLSPLGIALRQRHGGVALLLAEQGATTNIFDAVSCRAVGTAAALINGDNSLVLMTNAVGFSVAEVAAACGDEKTLKLLLHKGVSPNFQNPITGESLLYEAAGCDQTNTAQLLIQRHARLDPVDHLGFAPLHIAALRGSVDVLELLLKHKADCNQSTTPANSFPPSGPTSQLRQLGAGNTPMHLAALTGQTNVIVVLLKYGASINSINSHGMTPLDLADMVGSPPFVPMGIMGIRLPMASPFFLFENPRLRRSATIALLEQAGAKHGAGPRQIGMMSFGASTTNATQAPRIPVFQNGNEYHAQGCIDYNVRRFPNALAEFRKSCELGCTAEDYSYFRIWLIRARLGENEAATQELVAYLKRRKAQTPNDWPSKVGRFLAGQLSEGDFLKAADDPDLQIAKGQHCEAYFYIGSKDLIAGDRMGAINYFKKCMTTNLTDFEEYTSATSELLYLQSPRANL